MKKNVFEIFSKKNFFQKIKKNIFKFFEIKELSRIKNILNQNIEWQGFFNFYIIFCRLRKMKQTLFLWGL